MSFICKTIWFRYYRPSPFALFPLVNFTLISALSSDRFVSYNFFFPFFFSLSFSVSLRKRGRITETPRSIEITDNRDPVNQGPASNSCIYLHRKYKSLTNIYIYSRKYVAWSCMKIIYRMIKMWSPVNVLILFQEVYPLRLIVV